MWWLARGPVPTRLPRTSLVLALKVLGSKKHVGPGQTDGWLPRLVPKSKVILLAVLAQEKGWALTHLLVALVYFLSVPAGHSAPDFLGCLMFSLVVQGILSDYATVDIHFFHTIKSISSD